MLLLLKGSADTDFGIALNCERLFMVFMLSSKLELSQMLSAFTAMAMRDSYVSFGPSCLNSSSTRSRARWTFD